MENWQKSWKSALRTPDDLLEFGLVSTAEAEEMRPVAKKFQLAVPRYYAGLIDKQNPHCPIRRQALPDSAELQKIAQWTADPLGDLSHRPTSRITHRYPNRALLHLTLNCSMFCRFCFRKSLLNEESEKFFEGKLEAALSYIEHNPQIHEVIFSGGDPWMVANSLLQEVLSRLSRITSVRRVRFHTRVPVTFPERVDPGLCQILSKCALPKVIVTHFNHPKEITYESREGIRRLRATGATLLNQTVLLSGVNDEATALIQLAEGLFAEGVLPYYLHHPDQAAGTKHFDLPIERGIALLRELRLNLPGYLVPRYVRDSGDGEFKTPLG